MLRKLACASILAVFVLIVNSDEASAKRRLPHAGGSKPATTTRTTASRSRGVTTRVKFRADRRAVVVTFSNLGISSSVNYSLTYNSRGTTQGAGGTIKASTEDPTIREVIFGTCSHGVCRYDSGITNARLKITTTLKNGLRVVKPYRLKV